VVKIASSMTRNDDEKDYFVIDRDLVRFSIRLCEGFCPKQSSEANVIDPDSVLGI